LREAGKSPPYRSYVPERQTQTLRCSEFAALLIFEWDFDFDVTAGCGGIHDRGYFAYITSRDTPLGIPKHHYRDGPAPQVLLARNVLIRGNQNLEPGFFGSFEQLAIY